MLHNTFLQMLSALTEAGLGPQEVEHLWSLYEKAKAAEEKAGFNTGQCRHCAAVRSDSVPQCIQHREASTIKCSVAQSQSWENPSSL